MDISVVLINYRMKAMMERCLTSLYKVTSPGLRLEVIVVNKPSGDGVEEMLSTCFPQVRLLSETRPGVALARNRGMAEATGRTILHLDSDTLLLPGALESLVEFMDHHSTAGACAAKLLSPDLSVQFSCRRFYTLAAILYRRSPLGAWFPRARPLREHLMMDWDHDQVREIDWMQAAGFVIRREALESVGAFDERYRYAFEDVDWCYRARQAGWKIYYVPQSQIIHECQRTSARLNRTALEHVKSCLYFYRKHRLLPPLLRCPAE